MSKLKLGFFNDPDPRTREQKLEHALRAILEMAITAKQGPAGRLTKDQTDAIGMWCVQTLMDPADDPFLGPPSQWKKPEWMK